MKNKESFHSMYDLSVFDPLKIALGMHERTYTKEDQEYNKYRLVRQRQEAKQLAQQITATHNRKRKNKKK